VVVGSYVLAILVSPRQMRNYSSSLSTAGLMNFFHPEIRWYFRTVDLFPELPSPGEITSTYNSAIKFPHLISYARHLQSYYVREFNPNVPNNIWQPTLRYSRIKHQFSGLTEFSLMSPNFELAQPRLIRHLDGWTIHR
jgi:hypothetical protein